MTSNAVGFPCSNKGRRYQLDDDTRDGTSFVGAKAADWAAEKVVCLRELRR